MLTKKNVGNDKWVFGFKGFESDPINPSGPGVITFLIEPTQLEDADGISQLEDNTDRLTEMNKVNEVIKQFLELLIKTEDEDIYMNVDEGNYSIIIPKTNSLIKSAEITK